MTNAELKDNLAALESDLAKVKQLLATLASVLERGNEVVACEWAFYWQVMGLENRTVH